jgi:hypothetical protein
LMVCLVSWGNAQTPAKTIPIRIPLLCTIRKIGNVPKAPFEGRDQHGSHKDTKGCPDKLL